MASSVDHAREARGALVQVAREQPHLATDPVRLDPRPVELEHQPGIDRQAGVEPRPQLQRPIDQHRSVGCPRVIESGRAAVEHPGQPEVANGAIGSNRCPVKPPRDKRRIIGYRRQLAEADRAIAGQFELTGRIAGRCGIAIGIDEGQPIDVSARSQRAAGLLTAANQHRRGNRGLDQRSARGPLDQ